MAMEYFRLAPPPFRLHHYGSYDEYVRFQVRANAKKADQVWARRSVIEAAARFVAKLNGGPTFGLCHGTRSGAEQAWFEQCLPGCQVLGTELAPAADRIPRTIRWDFHEAKSEWLGAADFVYSNALDHAADPKRALDTWVSCLKPGGVCIVEHSPGHGPNHVSATDPFGVSMETFPYVVEHFGGGAYRVTKMLPAPGAKVRGTTLFVIQRVNA
jgi:hypothetical protein